MKTTLVLIEVMEAHILELRICGRSMGIVIISDLAHICKPAEVYTKDMVMHGKAQTTGFVKQTCSGKVNTYKCFWCLGWAQCFP